MMHKRNNEHLQLLNIILMASSSELCHGGYWDHDDLLITAVCIWWQPQIAAHTACNSCKACNQNDKGIYRQSSLQCEKQCHAKTYRLLPWPHICGPGQVLVSPRMVAREHSALW